MATAPAVNVSRNDRPLDHSNDRVRQIGAKIAQPPTGPFQVNPPQFGDGAAFNRQAAREQEEQQHAKAVDIGCKRGVPLIQELRRHVERRA